LWQKARDNRAQSRIGSGAPGCAAFLSFAAMHKLSLSEKVASSSDKTNAGELMQSIDYKIKNRVYGGGRVPCSARMIF
jgi:hypothetical protein